MTGLRIRIGFAALGLSLLLSACGSINVWPFGRSSERVGGGAPADATEYRCAAANQHFYLRRMEHGDAVWLIYPEREVRLNRGEGNRYTNGVATLDLDGSEAKLNDGPNIAWTGCKPVAKQP